MLPSTMLPGYHPHQVRLIMLPTTMAAVLQDHGAVDVLLRVGQSDRANPQLRLMCSTTLSNPNPTPF